MSRRRFPIYQLLLATAVLGSGCALTPASLPTNSGPAVSQTMTAARRVHLPLPKRYQGDAMSCGPSALWAVMGHHLGPGKVNFTNLDKSLRPTGNLTGYIGTMPGPLAKAAERYHLAATVTNGVGTRELRRQLDAGLPVIILGLYDDGEGGGGLHYVVVNGYEGPTDADTTWIITDSLVEDGQERRWSTKELMRFWDDLTLAGRRIPYQRATVNVAPKAKADLLPEDNRSAWVKFLDSTVKNVFELLRWLDKGRNGEAPLGWVPPTS